VSTRATTRADERDAPLASEAVTWSTCEPSAIETARLHFPCREALVVPRNRRSTKTLTVEPAGAVPDTVARDVASHAPFAGEWIAGAGGTARASAAAAKTATVTKPSIATARTSARTGSSRDIVFDLVIRPSPPLPCGSSAQYFERAHFS